MHTAMDRNGTGAEADKGGGPQGSTNMGQLAQTEHALASGSKDGQGSGQSAPPTSQQPSGTGYSGHTVLDGKTQASPQGAESTGNIVSKGIEPKGSSQNGSALGTDASQEGHVQPFAVKFPEDMPVTQELLDNYQAFCADCGLNNEQAQQAVDFYLKEQARQMDAERELSMHILESGPWKGQFEQRLSVANSAVRALNTQLGGRLQPMLEAGLGNNHIFAEMMACVGDLLQEENFIPHAGGGATPRSMSTEDFLRNEVFKTR
ncbi:hypothetical protein ACQ0P8_15940 [Halodesulfovibrio aestuarii]|uniref:Uncharacterized protein n=1 Tax=Halodesulfovibrio aestuarii TaxID=126333 RepID=A0A8G2CBA1_9BACT|nr:hypothetical protein [Halodesulfovibrio aestuarii]SHJ50383.1 hypothetical protein SAMN05660830_02614 [Halodesulfovibrio aestuarii]